MKKLTRFLGVALLLASTHTFAQEAFMLKYNLQPNKKYIQEVTTTQNVVQSMMGQEIKADVDVKGETEMIVEKIETSGNANILYTIRNFSVRSAAMGKDTTMNFKDVNNKISVTVSPLGKNLATKDVTEPNVKKIPGIDELSKNLKFMILPGKNVKVGEEWKDTQIDSIKPSVSNPFLLISKQDVEYKLVGKEAKDGKQYIKILSKGPIMVSGKGEQMGMEMMLEGSGKFEAVTYLDSQTMMAMYSEVTMGNDMTISIVGQQNMTIPMTQNGKTIVKITEKK